MRRFSWEESRAYWEVHQTRRAALDLEHDPDGLGNVCHSGQPLWLNAYYARFQKRVYASLLHLVPAQSAGSARALEVGCGAGRWCRLLAERGYRVTGIDLQPGLVEVNRTRFPNMEFHCLPIQDFGGAEPFDLVSSVTVIQHNPFDEQIRIAQKIRSLIRPGGHLLLLENLRDQGPHVFSRPAKGWIALFEGAGFRLVDERRYDYSPFSRTHGKVVAAARRLLPRGRPDPALERPESYLVPAERTSSRATFSGALRSLNRGVLHAMIAADGLVEPGLIGLNLPILAVHCGFLFQAA